MNNVVRLRGLTLYGKNKIREHGSFWHVVRRDPHVQALAGAPGLLLRADDGDERWVKLTNDPHFLVRPN